MARKHQMTINRSNGCQVIDLGPMEIWDGADLALLRETLSRLIQREGQTRVAVDMSHVKYVPSGFFGLLFDWCEVGATICLDRPCERVRNMIWFRQFLAPCGDGRFRLEREPLRPAVAGLSESAGWAPESEPEDQLATTAGDPLGV